MQIQSAGLRERASNITPVIVDVNRFKSDDELPLFGRSSEASISHESRASNRNAILLETPQAATEELVSGWNRSFSDAN